MRKWIALALVLAGPALAENADKDWVYFESRETGKAPQLELELATGERRTLRAARDTVLIKYLGDRAWGRHTRLSVDMGDRNRVVIAFDLPRALDAKKAVLVLSMKPSQIPPPAPFELGVYRVTGAWSEAETTWDGQPKFGDRPLTVAKLEARAGEVRLDLTDAVKGGLPHGVLLKITKPVKVGETPRAAPRPPPKSPLRDSMTWEASVAAARARATREKKYVLAFARGAYGGADKLTLAEEMLLAAALLHPDVRMLLDRRFVPVRVAYPPWFYTVGKENPADPLKALGTSLLEAKAPALIVATGEGKHVATLATIGTYDAWLVYGFLAGALKKASDKVDAQTPADLLAAGHLDAAKKAAAPISSLHGPYWTARAHLLGGDAAAALERVRPHLARNGMLKDELATLAGIAHMRQGRFEEAAAALARAPDRDEARYYLGCVRYRAGDVAGARAQWQRVKKDSPWYWKCFARLRWPARVAMFECLAAPEVRTGMATTELPREAAAGIRKGIAYLLAHQQVDGTWAHASADPSVPPAITALCARALVAHGQGDTAVARATKWLEQWLGKVDPARANAWSAGYTLDYFLDRFAADKSFRATAQKAVDVLLGGQCKNGAWSYNKRFDERWRGGFGGWPKTDQGRVHSMNTGPALASLARAKELGLKVDANALRRGREVLMKMRDAPGVFTYTYPFLPRTFNKTPAQSISRAPACELALWKLGATQKADLEKTASYFMEYRHRLRRTVKLTAGWIPPDNYSAYFFHFAYLHAADALDALGQVQARQKIREDLLRVGEGDGSWVDYEPYGKPYATAAALLVLR